MLIARVRVTATDEGRTTMLVTLTAEADAVPKLFDGCELFAVSVDGTDANTVMIAEEWASQSDFERYQTSDHFASIMATVAPCLAGPPDSAYYVGERVGP